MSLPPVLYHHFLTPLPYARALAAQQRIYALQHARRAASQPYPDVLLLLEHRPVYTGGRRQGEDALAPERARLEAMGADFYKADRGGQLTFHGPGQLVGYPLLDLARARPAVAIHDYVCFLQRALKRHLSEKHGVKAAESDETGVFLDEGTKVASIGVHVRHRLTAHGFAMNVTHEPVRWFDQIVACGLPDVRAGSIAGATGKSGLTVAGEVPGVVERLGQELRREIRRLGKGDDGEFEAIVGELEEDAQSAMESAPWPTAPRVTAS